MRAAVFLRLMSDGDGSLPSPSAVMLHVGAAGFAEQRRLLAYLGDPAPGLDDLALVDLLSWYLGHQPLRLRAAFRDYLADLPLPAQLVRDDGERALRGDISASALKFSRCSAGWVLSAAGRS